MCSRDMLFTTIILKICMNNLVTTLHRIVLLASTKNSLVYLLLIPEGVRLSKPEETVVNWMHQSHHGHIIHLGVKTVEAHNFI